MIYIGLSNEEVESFINKNKNIKILNFNSHPKFAKQFANKINYEEDYVIYNIIVLDYIPVDKIMFINKDGSTIKFRDKFQNELNYMYPGEIIYNKISELQ
jgi:hypothetical protein